MPSAEVGWKAFKEKVERGVDCLLSQLLEKYLISKQLQGMLFVGLFLFL